MHLSATLIEQHLWNTEDKIRIRRERFRESQEKILRNLHEWAEYKNMGQFRDEIEGLLTFRDALLQILVLL